MCSRGAGCWPPTTSDRQLERGYSLTLTADGQLVRSAAGLTEEQEIVTRLADGTVHSRVQAVGPADHDGPDSGGRREAGGSG